MLHEQMLQAWQNQCPKKFFDEKENFLSNTIWVKKIWFQNEIGKNNVGERKGGPQNFE